MKFLETVKAGSALAAEGIRLWVDQPRKLNLQVDHDWENRNYGMGELIRRAPSMKRIHLRCSQDNHDRRFHAVIAIDLEKRRIAYSDSSSGLLGDEHRGAAMISLALLSLPVTLPLSPVLVAWNQWYKMQEARDGMSRHGRALLDALKGKLDPDTEALLRDALKNDWSYMKKVDRDVTLDEARSILSTCDLVQDHLSAEEAAEYDDVEASGFQWCDDVGDNVANGHFYGSRDHYVRVCNTTFKDAEADELVTIFRTRKILREDDAIEE